MKPPSEWCAAPPYADYAFYAEHYAPVRIPETEFLRYIQEAGRFIDAYTYDRARQSGQTMRLAMCACALAEASFDTAQKMVVSEQNDGLRLTYADHTQTADSLPARKAAICRLHLSAAGLCGRVPSLS